MGMLRRHTVTIATTDGVAGDTDYTDTVINGYLESVAYSTTLSTGTTTITSTGTIAVVGAESGITMFTLAAGASSWTRYPRAKLYDTTGGLIGNTTDYPSVRFPVVEERLKVVTAGMSTSDAHDGTVVLITEGA